MSTQRILVVDDDPDISELLLLYLKKEGYSVTVADNGKDAVKLAHSDAYDLILLDVLLPGLDGFETCKEIRRRSEAPIIFMSCKGEDLDIIVGLGLGADDYVTKPFSPSQLMARVKANLRRGRHAPQQMLRVHDIEIDTFSHQVRVREQPVTLSSKEYQLLYLLAKHPGEVLTFDELYQFAWGADSLNDTRTLTVHVSNLRKKIGEDPSSPAYILTVRGVGYRMKPAEP